jgi:hypothetical protein
MFFNVIKGSYPSLQQIDKALPIDVGASGLVERGACLYESSGTWKLATATEAGSDTVNGAFIWFALQPDSDLSARMAGTPVQGSPGLGVINAIACSPTIEFETDMYYTAGSLTAGQFLQVGVNGSAVPGYLVAHTGNATAVAQVTVAPTARWVNNAVAVVGFRTGATKTVVRCISMYLPRMVTA